MNIEKDKKISFKKSLSGFKYIKSDNLKTLLPLDLINEDGNTIIDAEIPIFFKVSGDKFCYFLCNEFTKNISLKELISNNSTKIKTHLEKDELEHLYFEFNSLNELRESFKNEESDFYKFKNLYDGYCLDIKKGEKVLIITFKNETANKLSNEIIPNLSHLIQSFSESSYSKFEYIEAYKFNERYYLLNKDGNIEQSSIFRINEKQSNQLNYLVMPYTEENVILAQAIKNKMLLYKDTLNNLFKSNQNSIGLDGSIATNGLNVINDLFTEKTKKLKM